MRIFFDTEFEEDGRTIELISIGMVREDGQELYRESSEYDLNNATLWLRENVVPNLTHDNVTTRRKIANDILKFVGDEPEFWAYYADYDWVVLCQLYGRMMDLPFGWPKYCRDLKQLLDERGNPAIPKLSNNLHNSLSDARWVKDTWMWLNRRAA